MPSWLPPRPRFGPLEPWQRNQYVVVLTVALAQIGLDLTQPFMALYVRELGVTDLGEAAMWAGIVAGSAPLCAAVMGPIWGSMADRYGRRAMILRALTVISVMQMAQSFVPDVRWLLAARIILGLFAGFSAMAMALAVSLGPRERMGQAIGMVQAAQLLPTAIGPTIGGVLSDHFGLRTNFLITGLLLTIPTSLMFFVVREGDYAGQAAEPSPRRRGAPQGGWRNRLSLLAIPGFSAALGILFLARFADRALPPILPLLLSELDTPRAQLATITGVVVSIGAVSAACSATVYGRRSRPENNRQLLMIALGGGAFCSVLLALAQSWPQVLVLRLVLGLLAGGSLSLAYTLGARLAPAERSGLALGTLASCGQLGSASSPLLAGALGGAGLHLVFLTNAAAYLVAVALTALGVRAAHPAVNPELSSELEASTDAPAGPSVSS